MKKGFGQFCPVAVASEVFAERWTPIILRELFSGSHRFNEIHRCIPLMSRALLTRRLRHVRRRIAADRLPARRVVVHFSFHAVPATYRGARRFWLLLERSGVDLCVSDPGFEVDIYVDADLAAMARVWLGDMPFSAAVRSKKIRLTGMAGLIRQFPSWLLLSHFAGVARPRSRLTTVAA